MVIVHAVGPFDTDELHPPRELVRGLSERKLPSVKTDVPPTSRDRAVKDISQLIARHRPSAWIGVGYASNRMALSLEAAAVNLGSWVAEEAQPDCPADDIQARIVDGPAAYMTTLPVDEILAAWNASKVPGYLSLNASSDTCNLSFYAAAHAVADLDLDCMVGFLNVPRVPQMLTDPKVQASVPMDLQMQGVVDLVSAVCTCTSSAGPYMRGAL